MNRFENIPEELRKLRQWVIAVNDSKIPMNAYTGYNASSSSPKTWSSYDLAVQRVNECAADNIGFVFNDNGIIGIDIDTGWDENGNMTAHCADILNKCQSYTERSRSGRGFHLFIKGDIPFKGKNNQNGIEIYKTARYFITTGDVYKYTDIVENQSAIDYVLSTYFADTPDSRPGSDTRSPRIYNPVWEVSRDGTHVKLHPTYPAITQGSRHMSLVSVAGSLHNYGYPPELIYSELKIVNETACQPPVDDEELVSIVNSIIRYER